MQNQKYAHGGDIFGVARKYGVSPPDIIDLSSNVSYAIPAIVENILKNNADAIRHLPEPHSETLRQQLADHYQFAKPHLLCGAGTTELLQGLAYVYASQTALIVQPTYSEYEKYAGLFGCKIIHQLLEEKENFCFNVEQFCPLASRAQIVFLCNPNNPTGVLIDRETIAFLLLRFPQTLFVIDESYLPFVPSGNRYSILGVNAPNLVVLRSMSKIFAIPGLRVGWLFSSNAALVEKLRNFISPWSVNTLAQQVAEKLIAFEDPGLVRRIQHTKQKFLQQIASIEWLTPFPSETNFVLLKSHRYSSDVLYDYFAQHQILIRNCDNFMGLDQSHIRISIKEDASMQEAIRVFSQLSIENPMPYEEE